MGSLVGLLVGRRIFGTVIGEKGARAMAFAIIALAVLVALGTAKCLYDRAVISRHAAGQEAATAKADRKADAKAAEQRRADDARIVQESTQLEKVQANANTEMERRLARHRCLRLQQSARAEHRQPPTCV